MEIIRLENIIKKYHNRPVLNHISISFDKGSSVAFVGHNGCGKSTLLKCIAGLIAPDKGKIFYAMPLLFHYIPEKFPPTVLTAREYLMRMGEISGIRREEVRQSIAALGKDFFMEELLDTQMNVLSKGTLQKVGVMQALLKKPDVLLLDEPLSGQDEESQKVFIEKMNHLRNDEVTIFMACHEKGLVEAIAEDVYAIREGSMEKIDPQNKKEE